MKSCKRAILVVGALSALLPLGALSVEAATTTAPVTGADAGMATAFDRVIDLIVQQRTAAGKLSAADARVAREQLQIQFLSLTNAEQQSILAATRSLDSQESVLAAMTLLNKAVSDSARQALAEVQATQQAQLANSLEKGRQPKLGPATPDLVFVATVGPCRVYDSRFGPGQLPGFGATQIYGWSTFAGYAWGGDQGGTGTAGSGNCSGDVFAGAVSPVSVVATVAVVNTVSTGSLRAWNGGTTLTVGGVLGWNAGQVLSNTTVIPMDRTITMYPGSGPFKRDFGLFNNSPNAVDIIVDVVGYFILNTATALDCVTVGGGVTNLGAGVSQLIFTPSCTTGYTPIVAQPSTNVFGVYTGTLFTNACRITNTTGATVGVTCDAYCCRVPGR